MRESTLGTILALSLIAAAAVQAQQCGQRQAVHQKLVYEGYKAQAGAWPWHGALFQRKSNGAVYFCGATILTKRFVITAAHCTLKPQNQIYVKFGTIYLDASDKYVQRHNISRIIQHHEYDKSTMENDIALLELTTEIWYNDYVQPVCLWQGDSRLEKVVSKVGYLVGWGHTVQNGQLSNDLNEARLPIVSRRDCINSDRRFYSKFHLDGSAFCAGDQSGTNAGPGDSGSGLFLDQGESWVLRGIVSITKLNRNTRTADPKNFVVFTDVAFYLGWIKTHVTDLQNNVQSFDKLSQVTFQTLNNFEAHLNVTLRLDDFNIETQLSCHCLQVRY